MNEEYHRKCTKKLTMLMRYYGGQTIRHKVPQDKYGFTRLHELQQVMIREPKDSEYRTRMFEKLTAKDLRAIVSRDCKNGKKRWEL